MTTLKEIRRYLYELAPDLVGRLESVASLTTTTVVVTALGTGGYSSERFRGSWLLRAETATAADRVRKVTAFTSSSGTFTHAGTNYGDTTATSESVEILNPDYEPHKVDRAIQTILGTTRRLDRTIVPGVTGQSRYWLHDLSWLQEPGDIARISVTNSPVLTRNRDMEQWNTVSSAGALEADFWTLAGSGGTQTRTTTGARRGKYAVALVRSGADVTFKQSIGLLHNGGTSSPSSLAGQVVTGVVCGQTATASQLRVVIDDGVTTYPSSYHTGGGGWEELSIEATLSASATKCDVYVEMKVDGTAYVDQCYACLRSLNESVRRDQYIESTVGDGRLVSFEQNGTPVAVLPPIGFGQQYVFWTQRPYPRFNDTRLLAGSADADTSDAPKELIACGAMWRLHEGMGEVPDAASRYLAIASEYRERYEKLATGHLYMPSDHDGGVPLPGGAMLGGRAPRRG